MWSKAVLVDFKAEEIKPPYLKRIKKLLKSIEFISRDDPKLLISLKDAEVVLVKIFTKADREFIDSASKLKYIGVCSTAFDAIDTKYARSKNIVVCNLGGYSTEAVAEFFFAVLLEQVRELEEAKEQARKEDYSFDKFMGRELKDKILGVIGAGRIGSRIAEMGLGIGMRVIYFSRKKKPEIDRLGARKKKLDEVLSQSDVVSLNLALNKETEKIISKDKLSLLKKGCLFINTAPMALLDQETVIRKAVKGEMTFIFDHADELKPAAAKKFLATKNVVVYPPVAFRTEEANIARWETFVSNLEQFSKGKPQNVVN